MPHGSGLAQGGDLAARPQLGADAATFREPPLEASGKSQRPEDHSGPRVSFSHLTEVDYSQHPEEDEDDDKGSIAEPPVLDKTYTRLINFIYDRFANSRPASSANVPPCCEFEKFFAVSDPPSASRQTSRSTPGCGDESLRIVEAGHRPLATESAGSEDIRQDGDSPVSTSFGMGWRLDGVSRLEGCVLASSDASGVA